MRALWLALPLFWLSACSDGGSGEAGPGEPDARTLPCFVRFAPDKAQAGQDCRPRYGDFCPLDPAPLFNAQEPSACPGVRIRQASVRSGSLESRYWLLEPADGPVRGPTVIALHYALSRGATLIERMRLAELVAGRGVRLVVPDAPDLVTGWGLLLTLGGAPADPRINLLDALLTATVPAGERAMFMGVSGGAVMAYRYACERSAKVSGVLLIAGEVRPGQLEGCRPASPFATVQIHGTADLVAPYGAAPLLSAGIEEIYARHGQINGCAAFDRQRVRLPSPEAPLIPFIDVLWMRDGCASGRGNAVVKVENGGHNIPGTNTSLALPVNFFGPVSSGFDSTLQGYDLLRYLGG